MTKPLKILIFGFSLVIVLNLVVNFSVIHEQTLEIAALEKGTARARKGALQQAGGGIIQEQEEIKKILAAIPEFDAFTEHTAGIRELADKNQFVLEGNLVFTPAKTEKPDLLEYHTHIKAIGNYGKIKQFIADIQNLPGLNNINAIDMVREKTDPDKIKLSLELAVFFRRDPA